MASYDAFISYSHVQDKALAASLQAVMQKLGKPWYRRRALQIFRDATSLAATPELWPAIAQGLASCRYFIALASPQYAASHWCAKEVACWLEHKSIDTLLIVVAEGELVWDNAAGDFVWNEATPLPAVLKGRFRSEPKWIDLRAQRAAPSVRDNGLIDGGAHLAATIHGIPKEDLLSQELRAQRRALSLASSAAIALLLLAGGATWEWREAALARQTAETERDLAARNYARTRDAAERIAFNLAASVENMKGVPSDVVIQILKSAQSMVDDLLKVDPDDVYVQRLRAGILAHFTNVYLASGNLAKARTAADESLRVIRQLTALRPDNIVWRSDVTISLEKVGDVRTAGGDLAGALAAYEESLTLRRKLVAAYPNDLQDQSDLSISLRLVGQLRDTLGDKPGAKAAFEERLVVARGMTAAEPDNLDWQDTLSESLRMAGESRMEAGEDTDAGPCFTESIDILRRLIAAKPENPTWQYRLSVNLERLGTLRLAAGDRAAALSAFDENLTVRRQVVATNADDAELQAALAAALYKLSLVVAPARARTLLVEAIAIVDTLNRAGKLTDDERQWPKILADTLARLPAEEPAPADQGTPPARPSQAGAG